LTVAQPAGWAGLDHVGGVDHQHPNSVVQRHIAGLRTDDLCVRSVRPRAASQRPSRRITADLYAVRPKKSFRSGPQPVLVYVDERVEFSEQGHLVGSEIKAGTDGIVSDVLNDPKEAGGVGSSTHLGELLPQTSHFGEHRVDQG
jgi:hypothetical protein